MELIKWILMIAGILAFLIIGCMILLRSEENIDMLNETNEMLDTTLMELESYNEPLKKICEHIDNFNHKFLGQK